jgi:hypothetical protein
MKILRTPSDQTSKGDHLMKILTVGDTQKAACEQCESFVSVTFKLKDVPHKSSRLGLSRGQR